MSRDGEKTQQGIETLMLIVEAHALGVATERKPSKGLKLFLFVAVALLVGSRDGEKTQQGIETERYRYVSSSATTRRDGEKTQQGIETRKATHGLPPYFGRDGEKTQQGIETVGPRHLAEVRLVATERKPSKGLKLDGLMSRLTSFARRDGEKTQQGIETHRSPGSPTRCWQGRDGEKTQQGIETGLNPNRRKGKQRSRRRENPARD